MCGRMVRRNVQRLRIKAGLSQAALAERIAPIVIKDDWTIDQLARWWKSTF